MHSSFVLLNCFRHSTPKIFGRFSSVASHFTNPGRIQKEPQGDTGTRCVKWNASWRSGVREQSSWTLFDPLRFVELELEGGGIPLWCTCFVGFDVGIVGYGGKNHF